MQTMYDASTPQPHGVAGTNAVLIYAGGDTPHAWTPAEIAEQPERYRVPCWVRSNPAAAPAPADANSFLTWLRSHAAPVGCATVLDLETAVDPGWVSSFAAPVRAAGYRVLPYGSSSTLFKNPQLDGYFVAAPGAKALYPGSVATQYAYDGSYDLSWIDDTRVELWDTLVVPGNPVDTGKHYDAAIPGYGIPGDPEVGVIGQMVNGSGLYRGRQVGGGKTVFAVENRPAGYQCVAGFDAATLPAGTSLAVLLTDAAFTSTVVQTGEL